MSRDTLFVTVRLKMLSGIRADANREKVMFVGLVEVSCITSRTVRCRILPLVAKGKKGRRRKSDVYLHTQCYLCLFTIFF